MKSVFLALGAVSLTGLAQCMPTAVSVSVLGLQVGARPATDAVVVDKDLGFQAADGVRLSADVYRPRDATRSPAIMIRIPLSRIALHENFAELLGQFWASRGYAVVIQGVRGRFRSAGRYEPLVNEREDGIAALRWLKTQPWFDGRLGMFGGSAFGYTQWAVSDQREPGAQALLLQICSSDNYGFFYPGGALSLQSALYWGLTDRGGVDVFPTAAELAPGFEGFPTISADDRARGPVKSFDDWVSHPTRDDFWKAVDGTDRPERLAAPALLMAGWYDPYLQTQIADFNRIRIGATPEVARETRLIIGPWTHARQVILPGGVDPGDYRFASLAPSLPWFDRHLAPKGVARAEALAPVRLFVMGENRWRDEAAWPLARAVDTSFYLRSDGHAATRSGDGRLDFHMPEDADPADLFTYDPRNPVPTRGGAMLGPGADPAPQDTLEDRPDVLVYTTPPLTRAQEVTGPVTLELFVATSAPATDFTAKLVDVHPDGSAYQLSEGIVRRSYKPGAGPQRVAVDLWPTSNVFFRGHRIRLEVSSSNFPRFERHPNTAKPPSLETEPVTARQRVYHGRMWPSRLVLPLLPTSKAPPRAEPIS